MMYYFGTNLREHGHYLFNPEGDSLYPISSRDLRLDMLPFDAYDMKRSPKDPIRKGDVAYYQQGGYSVMAIEGSCLDTRYGTRSVFFVKEALTKEELKERILSIPIAKRIIERMPFKVDW